MFECILLVGVAIILGIGFGHFMCGDLEVTWFTQDRWTILHSLVVILAVSTLVWVLCQELGQNGWVLSGFFAAASIVWYGLIAVANSMDRQIVSEGGPY
jgi:hypothetical protein